MSMGTLKGEEMGHRRFFLKRSEIKGLIPWGFREREDIESG